jgi:hypothetical protein
MSNQPRDIVRVEVGIGELTALLGALLGLAGGFGIADNIHAGLTLAFGGGLAAYAGELGVAILAVGIASIWAVIIGLAVHLSLANIVAYYLSEVSSGTI